LLADDAIIITLYLLTALFGSDYGSFCILLLLFLALVTALFGSDYGSFCILLRLFLALLTALTALFMFDYVRLFFILAITVIFDNVPGAVIHQLY